MSHPAPLTWEEALAETAGNDEVPVVAAILSALPEPTRARVLEDMQARLPNGGWAYSDERLAEALRKMGFRVGHSSIRRYRRRFR